jgi:hypothetical protein
MIRIDGYKNRNEFFSLFEKELLRRWIPFHIEPL